MQLSRILVGVDYSSPAQAAFEEALALCHAHGAEVIVVHAVPAKRPFSWRTRQRLALLKDLRARAKSAGVRVTTSVQHGDAPGVILAHAVSRRPDLIVLGTHQRTGMDRLRTGSIAERVGTRAAQPVLIVPERARPAGVHPSIVVAVDFSRASDNALEHAVGFAAGIGGTVTLVHVIPEALAVSAPDALYPGALDYQHLLVRDAWRRLQESTPSLRAPDTTARARVLTGDPASAIARFADGVHADLIVVGLTRRGAVSRVVFGATAARLMRVASQPVLVIPEDFSHERYVDERSRSHAA